jgi:hypothetical protein
MAIGAGIGALVGGYSSNWTASGMYHGALAGMLGGGILAIASATPLITLGALYGIPWIVNSLRSGLGGYQSQLGLGGYKIDMEKVRKEIVDMWNQAGEEKQMTFTQNLRSTDQLIIMNAWDIYQFAHEKDSFTPADGNKYCYGTVTINNKVYFTDQANYFMWGLVNRLAYDKGYSIPYTSLTSSVLFVAMYRNIRYFYEAGSTHAVGRMAWTIAGWNAGEDGAIEYPESASLRHGIANDASYNNKLDYVMRGITD